MTLADNSPIGSQQSAQFACGLGVLPFTKRNFIRGHLVVSGLDLLWHTGPIRDLERTTVCCLCVRY